MRLILGQATERKRLTAFQNELRHFRRPVTLRSQLAPERVIDYHWVVRGYEGVSELHLAGDYERVRAGIVESISSVLDDGFEPAVVEELRDLWRRR